ncbi:hypothetical protein BH23ACT9_BH23ACT9_24080 [soil metagenome]
MEERLIPVNTLIGLSRVTGGEPAPLAEWGYRLVGLEVPLPAGSSRVVADAVFFNPEISTFIIAECKSGANVDVDQAKRYAMVRPDAAVEATGVDIVADAEPVAQPLYVCVADHADRIETGLTDAGVAFPIMTVDRRRVSLSGGGLPGVGDDAFPCDSRYPPAYIPFDHDSDAIVVDRHVTPILVARLTRRIPQSDLALIAEEAAPYRSMFGQGARNRLDKAIRDSIRRAADRNPDSFEYSGLTASRDFAVVRFTSTPEDAQRQGRTQAYQRVARAAGQEVVETSEELRLFDDVTAELSLGDEEDQEA